MQARFLLLLLCAKLQASTQKQTRKGALQVQWAIEYKNSTIKPVIPRMATRIPSRLLLGMPVRVA